jgi:hypothetical protein
MRPQILITLAGLLPWALVTGWPAQKTWNQGTAAWSNPGAWTPAGVPDGNDEIVIGGGVVVLDVPVVVSNRLAWTGGRLQNGTLRIAAGGTLEASGTADKLLLNAVLINAGTVRVSEAGRLAYLITGYGQSVQVTNEAGATFDLTDTAQIGQANGGGWPATLAFVNQGTFRKTGEGACAVAMVPFHNRGAVQVSAGLLRLEGGGTSPGFFTVSAGASVDLQAGTFDLAGSRWEGAGPVRIRGSSQLAGSFTADNFGHGAGDLTGTFEITGGFEWTGGRIVNAAARLGPGQHRVGAGTDKELISSSLANAGQLTVDGVAVGLRITGYAQSVFITNEASGSLILTNGAFIEQRNGGGWPPVGLAIVNRGELRSAGGTTNGITASEGSWTWSRACCGWNPRSSSGPARRSVCGWAARRAWS